jgi:hypothetical protein
MKILCHRGYWKNIQEKNTYEAFRRSFDFGFGTETDIRDICGRLVISHDCPTGNEMELDEFFKILNGRNLPLALNIKADGLSQSLKDTIDKFGIKNYFTFDMSIPDMFFQVNYGLRVFTGISDLNPNPLLLDYCDGIWLDSFKDDWFDANLIKSYLDQGKQVCIVSSELHKRDNNYQWNTLRESCLHKHRSLMLCTDLPEEANVFFNRF